VNQLPNDVKHDTLASLKETTRDYDDSLLTEQLATLQYETLELKVDDHTRIPFALIDDWRDNNTIIHNVHGSIHGTGPMSDAFVDFLPRAIQRQQLSVLSFDQESTLTKWTLGDFALFLKHQAQLRALVIPRSTILEDKPSDLLPANSNGSKELFVLTKRRATQVRHSGSKGPPLPFNAPALLQKLQPEQLTQNITVSIGIKFPISHHPRTLKTSSYCGAPLPLAHQLLTSAQENGGAINTLCIAETPQQERRHDLILADTHHIPTQARHPARPLHLLPRSRNVRPHHFLAHRPLVST
jgi:hypothetical protein